MTRETLLVFEAALDVWQTVAILVVASILILSIKALRREIAAGRQALQEFFVHSGVERFEARTDALPDPRKPTPV